MKHLARRAAAAFAAWLLVLGGCSGASGEVRGTGMGPVPVGKGLQLTFSDDCFGARQNLEDCLFLDARTAGRIRSVVRSTHPAVMHTEALEAAANAWLDTNAPNLVPIAELTDQEAQAAAAAAIGKICGGDEGNITSENITALALYLCALPPEVPEQLAVSDNSIHIRSARATGQENGTFLVTVEFTTQFSWQTGDDLTVTVICGDKSCSFALGADHMEDVHQVMLRDVTEPNEVRLQITGWQRAEDVFLFEGGIMAYGDCLLPVHAEKRAWVSGDRILTIHADTGRIFEIYRVAELWEFLSGIVVLNSTPTAQELKRYAVPGKQVAAVRTNEEGTAFFNFTAAGCSDGVYLVLERRIAGGMPLAMPVYVMLPGVSPEGEEGCSHVAVSPE